MLVVLLAGVALSLLAGAWYEREERMRLEQAFLLITESHLRNVEHTLEHNREALTQLGLLYELSREFDFHAFQRYLSGIDQIQHRFQAIEWIPRVTRGQREAFERDTAAVIPGFRITERLDQSSMVAATERDVYYPVVLIEPLEGNEAALGFDLASEKTRRQAIQRTIERGEFTVSGRITLVQEKAEQYGVLAFFPVHRNIHRPSENDRLDRDLMGFTLGVFRVGDLLNYAIGDPDARGVNVLLEDLNAPETEQFLHYHSSRLFPATGAGESVSRDENGVLQVQHIIDFGGRTWQLTFTSAEGFFQVEAMGNLVRVGGITLSLMLTLYLVSMIYRDRHISSLLVQRDLQQRELQSTLNDVESQRQEIEQSRKEWTATFDAVTDPIFVHDDQYRLVRVNDAYSRIAGEPIEALLGRPYYEVFPLRDRPLNSSLDMMASGEESALEEDESFEHGDRQFVSHVYLIPGESGSSPLGVHIVRDMTEDIRLDELRQEHAALIKRALVDTIYSVSLTVEKRDPYTAGHQHRVARLAVEISRLMDLDELVQEGLYFGGLI
ncbi:MAG: CHASE domain-containing protein, partial [Sedimenticola sp.]